MSALTDETNIAIAYDPSPDYQTLGRLNQRRLDIIEAQLLIPQKEFGIEFDINGIIMPDVSLHFIGKEEDSLSKFVEPYTEVISEALQDDNLNPECTEHLVTLAFVNKGSFPRLLLGNKEIKPDERILEILGHAQRLETEIVATTSKGKITLTQAIFLKAIQRAELRINERLGII